MRIHSCFPGLPHDLVRADAGRRQQNVSSSPHMFLGTIAVRNDRFEPTTIGGRRVTMIPVHIPQIRMPASRRESPTGLFRQILSIRRNY